MQNVAFIDGQNLYLGAKIEKWSVHHIKFRRYLREKYAVTHAYYFLGFFSKKYLPLYRHLKAAGFKLCFREHSHNLQSNKKGNVDTDIVFTIMKKLIEREPFHKVLIVSGDGDYKLLITFLIKRNCFEKILFPNHKYASSLYRTLGGEYFDYLDTPAVRQKIQHTKNT